jgi:hypothetical protein
MTDMVKFLDPIIDRADPNNVGWNVTQEIVKAVIEVSNIASGSMSSCSFYDLNILFWKMPFDYLFYFPTLLFQRRNLT